MARVFVTRNLPFPALERLDALHSVDVWEGALPPAPEELRRRVASVEGLLCLLTDRVDGALLDAAPSLRVVSNFAVGADNVDVAACSARGVGVGGTPDVLTDATADLAVALMLAAARRLSEAAEAVRAGAWRTWEPAGWLGLELAGARLVVVGPGRIGRAVAVRAAAFGMEVVFVGRGDDLLAALSDADVVSLHVPLTASTRGMIGREALAAMKPSAVLVNTARGGLVDSCALAAALGCGALGAAALDVTDPEPPAEDDALLSAPRLIVVPHIGSATHAARARMAELAVENLLAGLDGRALPHPPR